MSDKNITACVSCDQPFGFVFHRRHQCERCQAWVCSNCSKARAVLWSASTTSSNKNRHPASSRICVHCRCELYARRRGLAIDGVLQSYLAEYLLAQEYDKAKPPMTEGGSTNTIGPLDAPRECVPCKDKGTDDHGGEGNNGNNNNSNNIWSKPTGRSNTATNGNVCVVGPDANGHDTNHACTCVPTCMCSVRLLGKAHFRSELQGISLVLEQLERELSGFMPPARESPTTPPCPYHQPKPQPHEDKKESPSVEQQAAAEAEKGIQLQALMQKMNDLSFQAAQVTDKLAHLRVEVSGKKTNEKTNDRLAVMLTIVVNPCLI